MWEWLAATPSQYDCIVTVTTLHHVDFALAVTAIAGALKPAGRLLVIDVVDRSAARYFFVNVFAAVLGAVTRVVGAFQATVFLEAAACVSPAQRARDLPYAWRRS